jgi:hypothetical protein
MSDLSIISGSIAPIIKANLLKEYFFLINGISKIRSGSAI